MSLMVEKVRRTWRRFRVSPWYRVAELGVLTVSFGLMLYTLINNLSKIDFNVVRFDLGAFLVAVFMTWIAVWLGAMAWSQILKALQPQISRSSAVRSHMLSLTTKYLPGFGWQQVSKVIQLGNYGVPGRQAVSAAVFEVVLLIFTGFVTAMQILVLSQQNFLRLSIPPVFSLGILVVLWASCLIAPLLLLKIRPNSVAVDFNRKHYYYHMILAEVFQAIGWLIFGISLWFLGLSVYSISVNSIPNFVVALVMSFIIGFLVVIAPNGLGVREFAMLTLLQVSVPLSIAVVISFMSRIVLVSAELLAALPFIFSRYKRSLTKPQT